jgi:hypothetical protein
VSEFAGQANAVNGVTFQLTKEIEAGIADDFVGEVDVLLRTAVELRSWSTPSWHRGPTTPRGHATSTSCGPRPPRYGARRHAPQPGHRGTAPLPDALVRRVDHHKQSKSPLTKIVGTPVYKQMTVRNITTVPNLVELANTDASACR